MPDAASERSDTDGEATAEADEERRHRRAIIVFLLATTGAYAMLASPTEPIPGDLYEATGDLTVTVVDQRGDPASGRDVAVVNPDTGDTVASGTTASDGTITVRNIEQATYTVRVDGRANEVTLASAERNITVGVTVTPAKSYRPPLLQDEHRPEGAWRPTPRSRYDRR